MADLNVTPLIDVVLVLLVVFMVVAPMVEAGLPVELPPVQDYKDDENIVQTVDEAKYIIISVAGPDEDTPDAGPRWGVGGGAASNRDELLELINTEISKDEEQYNRYVSKRGAGAAEDSPEDRPFMRRLLIKGDRNLSYGQVREVMDIISDGGWGTMQLAVDQGS